MIKVFMLFLKKNAIYCAILLVIASSAAILYFSHSIELLDAKPYYSAQYAIRLLASFDDDQARNYKIAGIMDLFLFIPSYFLFFISLLQKIQSKIEKKKTILYGLIFATALIDIIETSANLFLLKNIRNPAWHVLASISQFATPTKWGLLATTLLIVFYKKKALK